jgi:hypothetical protein
MSHADSIRDALDRAHSPLPTHNQIVAFCEAIRATWTPKERAKRRMVIVSRWSPPVVSIEVSPDNEEED